MVASTVISGLLFLAFNANENGVETPTIAFTTALLASIAFGGAMRLTNSATPFHKRTHVIASLLFFAVAFLTVNSLGAYIWPSALLALVTLLVFRSVDRRKQH